MIQSHSCSRTVCQGYVVRSELPFLLQSVVDRSVFANKNCFKRGRIQEQVIYHHWYNADDCSHLPKPVSEI